MGLSKKSSLILGDCSGDKFSIYDICELTANDYLIPDSLISTNVFKFLEMFLSSIFFCLFCSIYANLCFICWMFRTCLWSFLIKTLLVWIGLCLGSIMFSVLLFQSNKLCLNVSSFCKFMSRPLMIAFWAVPLWLL